MSPRAYEKAIISSHPVGEVQPEVDPPVEVKGRAYEAAISGEPVRNVSPAGNKFGDKLPPEVTEDMGVSAIQGYTGNWADDAADLVSEKMGDSIREAHATARERSPILSTMTETAAEQLNPILKAGSLRKNVLTTMAKIFGHSEDKISTDTAMGAAAGAGLDVAVDVGLKAAKIPFANASKTLRARVAGAGTTEFKDVGINDREKIAEKMHKLGFMKGRPMEFDLESLSFKPAKTEANIILQKPTSEVLQERAIQATQKMKKEYDFIVGVADKAEGIQVPAKDLVTAIEQTFAQYSRGARGRKRLAELQPHLDDLYEDVLGLVPGNFQGGELADIPAPIDVNNIKGNVSLKKLAEWKSFLQDEATYGKDALLKDIPYIEDFYSDLAYKVNQVIQHNVPGQTKRLQDLGMNMHDLLVIQRDLKHKIARQKATGLVNPPSLLQGRQGSYAAQKLIETLPLGSTDEGLLNRANAQDLGGKIKDVAPEAVDFLRQTMEIIPKEIGKAFNSKDPGRSPNSVNLPEMLLKTKIPRTAQGIVENQKVVLAKLAQQDPQGNFYNFFKEMVEERPEEIPHLLPMLVQSNPEMFDRDPYGRIDNKITDQTLKLKAINDTMKRDDMTSTEKISIINNLNMTGEFLDY